MEVTVAGRRERLQKGGAYQFSSNLPHRRRNIGNGRARLISPAPRHRSEERFETYDLETGGERGQETEIPGGR